jgi:hypothetical protein
MDFRVQVCETYIGKPFGTRVVPQVVWVALELRYDATCTSLQICSHQCLVCIADSIVFMPFFSGSDVGLCVSLLRSSTIGWILSEWSKL